MDSKRRVQRYMTDHSREKGTADWLRGEYGDDLPAFPVTVEGAAIDLPWSKVQRHFARLVKEDRFFTEQELDNFEDIDPAAIQEQLESGEPSAFVEQVMADVGQLAAEEQKRTVREVFEQYKPIITDLVLADEAYQNACRNSDRETAVIEGDAAVKRAALTVTDPDFMRLYFDMPDFRYRLHREVIDETYAALSAPREAIPEYDEETPPWGVEIGDHSPWGKVQESKKLVEGIYQISTPGHGGIMVRETDAKGLLSSETIAAGGNENGWCYFEEDAVAPIVIQELTDKNLLGEADRPARGPLAPAYDVGDTVYLEGTAYTITDVNLFDVQLRDPSLPIPLLRAESKENFERLLRLDSRNGHITQYLPADLASFNNDFRDVLTNHLLPRLDKISISGWLRSGMDNRQIAQRMSLAYRSREDTVTLETGDIADYRTTNVGMSVEIQDKFGTNLAVSWEGIAPVIRALWLQELDGFSHVPEQRAGVELEGRLSYHVGDKVAFGYGNHDVKGTIEGIGAIDVVIHTGPYAWSHQTVSKNFFEEAVRHDERNAHLFTQEPELTPAPEVTPGTATIYPGDKNGLPFDVVVQRLPVDEPEQDAPRNFRITDDHLGEGGLKEKFRRNLEAVTTLHEIEFDKRDATPAEQEILSCYVGWGALADAFDPKKPDWSNEYKELQVVLTPEEYESARASTLNAHYTSPTVIKAIYSIVEKPKRHGKSYNKWLGDKPPSHRDRLRMAIDAVLEKKPADLEALLALLREAGIEVSPRGKAIRLKAPGQKKYVRLDADSMGEAYSMNALMEVLSGKRTHVPSKKNIHPADPPKVNLLVDIQAKLQEGKGAG